MGPGLCLVVERPAVETAVEDADETVAEGSKRLVVEISGVTVLVVEGTTTRTGAERTEGPLVDGVVEAPVAHVAGQDGPFLSRGDGDG